MDVQIIKTGTDKTTVFILYPMVEPTEPTEDMKADPHEHSFVKVKGLRLLWQCKCGFRTLSS